MALQLDYRDFLAAFADEAPTPVLSQLETATPDDVLWMGAPPVRIDLVKGVVGELHRQHFNITACRSG